MWKEVKFTAHPQHSSLRYPNQRLNELFFCSLLIHFWLTSQKASSDGLPPRSNRSSSLVHSNVQYKPVMTPIWNRGTSVWYLLSCLCKCAHTQTHTRITLKDLKFLSCYSLYSRNCCNLFRCSADIWTALVVKKKGHTGISRMFLQHSIMLDARSYFRWSPKVVVIL